MVSKQGININSSDPSFFKNKNISAAALPPLCDGYQYNDLHIYRFQSKEDKDSQHNFVKLVLFGSSIPKIT
jgi:hypothetical protein